MCTVWPRITSTDLLSWSRATKSLLLDLQRHAGDGIAICPCGDTITASPSGGITLSGVETFNVEHWSLASAMDFADRQFLEFAELQLSGSQHLLPEFKLVIHDGSDMRSGNWMEASMLLSASLLLPAGAGVVTQSGSTSIEVTHVDL